MGDLCLNYDDFYQILSLSARFDKIMPRIIRFENSGLWGGVFGESFFWKLAMSWMTNPYFKKQ